MWLLKALVSSATRVFASPLDSNVTISRELIDLAEGQLAELCALREERGPAERASQGASSSGSASLERSGTIPATASGSDITRHDRAGPARPTASERLQREKPTVHDDGRPRDV